MPQREYALQLYAQRGGTLKLYAQKGDAFCLDANLLLSQKIVVSFGKCKGFVVQNGYHKGGVYKLRGQPWKEGSW